MATRKRPRPTPANPPVSEPRRSTIDFGGLTSEQIREGLGPPSRAAEILGSVAEIEGLSVSSPLFSRLQESALRYEGIINQAEGSAARARERAAEPPPTVSGPDPQLAAIFDLHKEVSRVSGTVGDMAESVASMAKVANDAERWLVELLARADATVLALEESRDAAGRLGKINIFMAVVIAGLTVVLVLLALVRA